MELTQLNASSLVMHMHGIATGIIDVWFTIITADMVHYYYCHYFQRILPVLCPKDLEGELPVFFSFVFWFFGLKRNVVFLIFFMEFQSLNDGREHLLGPLEDSLEVMDIHPIGYACRLTQPRICSAKSLQRQSIPSRSHVRVNGEGWRMEVVRGAHYLDKP